MPLALLVGIGFRRGSMTGSFVKAYPIALIDDRPRGKRLAKPKRLNPSRR